MTSQADQTQDAHLLSFVIASADMRYVEVNERHVYMRQDPELGLIVRGEMPGCGSACYVDLNQILLEHALSCEGCKDHVIAEETAEHFGRRLAKALIDHFDLEASPADQLATVYECLLRSMAVPFEVQRETRALRYELAYSPLHQAAEGRALNLGLPMARWTFVTLCESIAETLAPEWELLHPVYRAAIRPIQTIELVAGS
ncbi:MAG: hypothetical protein JSW55_02555 [Chloroflexota bacterium]|nr:MAG: hypothetical protein JSW55_02555 [Chloroflexota bacterium]